MSVKCFNKNYHYILGHFDHFVSFKVLKRRTRKIKFLEIVTSDNLICEMILSETRHNM